MRISIAMATYYGERFIREQLDSLARQTYLPCELVVTDDGSTDRTLKFVDDFARTAPFPVRIYRNERSLGYGDNFLKAASLCLGDWIAFCDQDDVWLPQKLQTVSSYFDITPDVHLVTHSAALVDEGLRPLQRLFPRHTATRITDRLKGRFWYTLYGFTAVFRRELIHRIPWQKRPEDFTEPGKMQSHDLWIYFLASCLGKVVFLTDVLVLYRRHHTAATGSYSGSRTDQIAAIFHADRTHYRFLEAIAREYRAILLESADTPGVDTAYRERFRDASKFMESLIRLMHNRSTIHSRNINLFHRAAAFFENFRINRQTPSGDFTARTFAKDLLGVFGLWPTSSHP